MNIAIYGKSGSGKSTVSDYLVKRYKYVHCHPGARCRELAIELFDDDSKATLNGLSDCLRSIDTTVWLRAALRGVQKSAIVVFDGMRYEQDFLFFQNLSFSMWCVRTTEWIRYKRLKQRGQVIVPGDERHLGETELQNAQFDIVLTNNGDKAKLYAQVDAVLQRDSSHR